MDWCTIESDPGVFTSMLRDFGVSGVQVEELWSLDKSAYEHLKPVHALIFLFKYDQTVLKETHKDSKFIDESKFQDIYFAKQMISNACATQAMLNICLNLPESSLTLGNTLTNFKEFTQHFTPETRGVTLSNSDEIRQIHNSFAKQTLIEIDRNIPTKKEEPFHFVAYLPFNKHLIELDGLQEKPIDHGQISSNWMDDAQKILEARMQKYGSSEIRFTLLGLVADKKASLEKRLAEETEKESMDSDMICQLQAEIEAEDNKFERYAKENVLRKHNFMPMIMEHFRLLAQNGDLVSRLKKCQISAPAK